LLDTSASRYPVPGVYLNLSAKELSFQSLGWHVPPTSNRKLCDQLGCDILIVIQSLFHHSREVSNSLLLARRAFVECAKVRTTCILHFLSVLKEVLLVIFEALDLFGRESGLSSFWGQDLAEFRSYPCRRSNEVYHTANFCAEPVSIQSLALGDEGYLR
jgi:hypothetical protein